MSSHPETETIKNSFNNAWTLTSSWNIRKALIATRENKFRAKNNSNPGGQTLQIQRCANERFPHCVGRAFQANMTGVHHFHRIQQNLSTTHKNSWVSIPFRVPVLRWRFYRRLNRAWTCPSVDSPNPVAVPTLYSTRKNTAPRPKYAPVFGLPICIILKFKAFDYSIILRETSSNQPCLIWFECVDALEDKHPNPRFIPNDAIRGRRLTVERIPCSRSAFSVGQNSLRMTLTIASLLHSKIFCWKKVAIKFTDSIKNSLDWVAPKTYVPSPRFDPHSRFDFFEGTARLYPLLIRDKRVDR